VQVEEPEFPVVLEGDEVANPCIGGLEKYRVIHRR
jgi:hypothetical protein